MRLCHPSDGSTSPKYKLLCFITTKKIAKSKFWGDVASRIAIAQCQKYLHSGRGNFIRLQDPVMDVQGGHKFGPGFGHPDVGVESQHSTVHPVRTEADDLDSVVGEFQLVS